LVNQQDSKVLKNWHCFPSTITWRPIH